MSDHRLFIKTSHGALHRPSCPNVAKLKGRTKHPALTPAHLADPWRLGAFVAQCCAMYGRVEEVRAWRWIDD